MYNKATEVTNKTSALKSERVKNKKVLPVANRWRIEAQSHGFQTLDRVFRVFDNGQDLYIGIGKKRRGISIDYSVMHMLVFQSILELSPPSNHNTKSYNAHTRLLDLTYPGISDALMEMDI
jgi:Ca2+-binding EF-hand superfamily protein